MKKTLFVISFLVIMGQLFNIAEASNQKYILQQSSIDFLQLNSTDTNIKDIKNTEEVKENSTETVNTNFTKDEQNANKIKEEQKIKETKEENIEQPQISENVQNTTANISTTINKVQQLSHDSQVLMINGLLMMRKAFDADGSNTDEEYFSKIQEINSMQTDEKYVALENLENELMASINEKLQVRDIFALQQDEKYTWGKGVYIIKVATNRQKNSLNEFEKIFAEILNNEINTKEYKIELLEITNIVKDTNNKTKLKYDFIEKMDNLNNDANINVKIPKTEDITVPLNSPIIEIYAQYDQIPVILHESYSDLISELDFTEYYNQEKDIVSEVKTLSEKEQTILEQDVTRNAVLKGLKNFIKNGNDNQPLSEEQKKALIDSLKKSELAEEKYVRMLDDCKRLQKNINKNKMLKSAMFNDIQIMQNIEKTLKENQKDLKTIIESIKTICSIYKIEE